MVEKSVLNGQAADAPIRVVSKRADVQLSLSQLIPIAGSVMVTTPQEISIIDVVKGIAMFEKVEIPILGIVENMSHYTCPACGHRDEIFSHGGGKRLHHHGFTAIDESLVKEVPLPGFTLYNEFKPADLAAFQKFFDLFSEKGIFSSRLMVDTMIYKG